MDPILLHCRMTQRFAARNFDPMAFARAGAQTTAEAPLSEFARLQVEAAAGVGVDPLVHWAAQGELRADATGQEQAWLQLQLRAMLPMTCQRCLGPVDGELQITRSFRFVADEATAEAQDDASEEDVLALQRDFNLHDLIEDELLMELPLVPRHVLCPGEVKLAVADVGFASAGDDRPHPFAALAGLKPDQSG